MNILILTGRFGMGHYTATAAIKEEIANNILDANVQVIDIFDYLMPSISNLIYGGFDCLVKTSSTTYNVMCKASENYSSAPFKRIFTNKIDKLLAKYCPDIIISTVPIGSQYLSAYKELCNIDIPLFTYITDLFTHAEWIAKNTDLYFVGTHELKSLLIKKGISSEQIRVSGIPVKSSFKTNQHKKNNNGNKKVLIMGGGLGLMSFSDILYDVLAKEPSIDVTIITGKNKTLFNNLKSKYPTFHTILYTDKVYEYMRNSDLLISKAGGITVFEAIYTETPLCVINPFLLQEISNAKYVDQRQLGSVSWNNNENAIINLLELLKDETKLNIYKSNMKALKEELDDKAIIKELNLRKDYFNECCINSNCNSDCGDSLLWDTSFRLL